MRGDCNKGGTAYRYVPCNVRLQGIFFMHRAQCEKIYGIFSQGIMPAELTGARRKSKEESIFPARSI